MNWHYLENGQPRGPISEEEFKSLVQSGVIRADTHLWCEGMAEWKTYGDLLGASVPAAIDPSQAPAAAAPATGGLRIRRDTPAHAAPAQATAEHEAACSHCGTVVPVSQLMTLGASQLCVRCQAAHRRLSFSGPEGDMVYANPGVRLVAYILDNLICAGVVIVTFLGSLFLLKSIKPNPTVASLLLFCVIAGLVIWVINYFVGKIARDGATPMMKAFGIKVVTAGNGPVGGWRAFGRWLMIGLINQFTAGLGHVVAFFDKQRRSLHDMVCGTFVVKR